MSTGRPSRRDALVASGSAVAVVGFLVSGVAVLLTLIEVTRIGFAPASYKLGQGFDIGHDAVLAVAFALASVAFAGRIEARGRRIAHAAMVAAVAFTAWVVAQALYAASEPRHAGSLLTSDVLAALAAAVLVAAASAAAIAFRHADATSRADQSRRDGLLGLAAGGLAVSLALSTASAIVFMTSVTLAGGGDAGLRVSMAGLAVAIGGGAIAASAFVVSRHQQRQAAERWMSRREGLLAISLAVFVVGFLLIGIGNAIIADASRNFTPGLVTTAHWLEAISGWVVSGGAALAATGFFISRRSGETIGRN